MKKSFFSLEVSKYNEWKQATQLDLSLGWHEKEKDLQETCLKSDMTDFRSR